MGQTIGQTIASYFVRSWPEYVTALGQHVSLSLLSVLIACLVGIPLGIWSARVPRVRMIVTGVFSTLRVIPSLAILFLCVVLLKLTGIVPAVLALSLLALPPILINSTLSFSTLSPAVIETAQGMGMSKQRLFWTVKVPLALPLIFTGLRSAVVEVIASATLAAYIGAGGLGSIIMTGFALMDNGLLLVGGCSVALVSLISGWLLSRVEKRLTRFQQVGLAGDKSGRAVSAAYKRGKPKQGRAEHEELRRTRRRSAVAFVLVAVILVGIATVLARRPTVQQTTAQMAGSTMNTASAPVRIGSKNFTESLILGNLYADALEDRGMRVERRLNLASNVVHTSLVNNQIDLYPEYTGTGLLAILKLPLETDPQKVYDTVKTAYEKKWRIAWLDYAPANDSQGLVITKEASDTYGIKTISDLQRHATQLRFATQGEFDQRADGLPALEKAYGPFSWKSSSVYDTSLLAAVLLNGRADVAPLPTTDGSLVNPNLVALSDDKHVWPPYNVAPVARENTLNAHPEIAPILNAVDKTLTTEKLTKLNAQVDIDKQEPDKVAHAYYETIKTGVRHALDK